MKRSIFFTEEYEYADEALLNDRPAVDDEASESTKETSALVMQDKDIVDHKSAKNKGCK